MGKHADLQADPRRSKTAADAAYLQRVGARVRAARDRLGLTRKSLSNASGVSERYLADLETGAGTASLMVLRRIATALAMEIEELLSSQLDAAPELRAAIALLRAMPATALPAALYRLEFDAATSPAHNSGRIALIGLRGAGKSTVGRAAAERLGVPFIELDREVERAAGMELSEIFALQGKSAYRQHELRCLEAVVRQHDRAVIATGGSLVTEPAAYELLPRTCHVVWLKADPASHMDRVLALGDLRPMSGTPQPMTDLRAILQSRETLYARAHAVLDTTGTTQVEAISHVLATLPSAISNDPQAPSKGMIGKKAT